MERPTEWSLLRVSRNLIKIYLNLKIIIKLSIAQKNHAKLITKSFFKMLNFGTYLKVINFYTYDDPKSQIK